MVLLFCLRALDISRQLAALSSLEKKNPFPILPGPVVLYQRLRLQHLSLLFIVTNRDEPIQDRQKLQNRLPIKLLKVVHLKLVQ